MDGKRLAVEHGVVCSRPNERFGYFGWPSVARTPDGTLVVGASGPRRWHACPWGKTSLFTSTDNGRSWSGPRIVNNTPLDDRDVGVVSLGGARLLISWFTNDPRTARDWNRRLYGEQAERECEPVFDAYTEETVEKWEGRSWIRTSPDGHAWSDFLPAPVTTPHGPIRLADGGLLYLGKAGVQPEDPITAARSNDEGRTWTVVGTVPIPEDRNIKDFWEPHAVELPSGTLVGMARFEDETTQRDG